MANERLNQKLPTDQNGNAVAVMAPAATASIAVAVGTASVALPTDADPGTIIRIACDTNCYIAFGTSGVTAASTDALFVNGVEYFQVPDGASHMAAIRVSADGVLRVTTMV
jgi:hypothetical protein